MPAGALTGRRPWLAGQQLPYLGRAVRWQPVLGLGAVAAILTPTDVGPAFKLAVMASGLSYVLDDPAESILDATPASRPRRRFMRLGLTLPLFTVMWLGLVQPLWSFGPATPAAGPAALALAALAAVVLAGAAAGGGAAGAPLALALVLAGRILPAPWTLHVGPGEPRTWSIILVSAVTTLIVLSRDPARQPRRMR